MDLGFGGNALEASFYESGDVKYGKSMFDQWITINIAQPYKTAAKSISLWNAVSGNIKSSGFMWFWNFKCWYLCFLGWFWLLVITRLLHSWVGMILDWIPFFFYSNSFNRHFWKKKILTFFIHFPFNFPLFCSCLMAAKSLTMGINYPTTIPPVPTQMKYFLHESLQES